MQLHIELLQGTRKGHAFDLLPAHIANGLAVEHILERDGVLISMSSEVFLDNVVLHVGGYDLKSEYIEKSDQLHCYSWCPKYKKPYGYEALFHNFFGIAQLIVGYTIPDDEQQKYVEYQPVEIMATKLTAEQTESMVSFILENNDKGVLSAISPTNLQSTQVSKGVVPGELLAMLENTVKDAYVLCRPIIKKPMTRLRNELKPLYDKNCEISDDQGIGWMLDNLSVLYPVSNPDDALLENEGAWYAATEVLSSSAYESTNIYENQLIHLFLTRIRREAENIVNGLSEQQKKFVSNAIVPEGYVSFFNMMQHRIGRTTNTEIFRARECIRKIEELLLLLRSKVPAEPWRVRSVQLTERIKLNKNYLRLMGMMKRWFTEREIDWKQHHFLASINSTPVLFELYCCLILNKYLRTNGEDHNVGNGLFSGSVSGHQMQLYYEPNYWKSGHRNGQSDSFINTDLNKVKKSIDDFPGKERKGRNERRSPDFVIEVEHRNVFDKKTRSLLVLDAKYMMESKVFEEQLQSCTMKYVHGIHSRQGEAVVKTMILLHPDARSKPGRYLSYHTSPYDINGTHPVYPILGVQAMELAPDGVEQGLYKLLDTTIKKLYSA